MIKVYISKYDQRFVMSRTRFKFKSSGKLVTARSVTNPSTISNPIGIKTPLEFGIGRPNEDYLKMHFNPADQRFRRKTRKSRART